MIYKIVRIFLFVHNHHLVYQLLIYVKLVVPTVPNGSRRIPNNVFKHIWQKFTMDIQVA